MSFAGRVRWSPVLICIALAVLVAPSAAGAKARTGPLPVADRTELYRATCPPTRSRSSSSRATT